MHRTKLLQVAIIAAAFFAAGADGVRAQQTFELRGRVVDSISGQPLQDAVVRLPVLGVYTLTDGQGLFRFADISSAMHLVEITQLGYGEQSFRVLARPDSFVVLRIAPQPVRLDTLVVDSRIMHRTAQRRAAQLGLSADRDGGLHRRAVFWDAYDREKIVASGISDPIEFLDSGRGAKLSIDRCAGANVPAGQDRLCLKVPFMATSQWGQTPRNERLRRLSITQRSVLSPLQPAPSRVVPRVFLDDRQISLEEIRQYVMDDIGRVETYGMRGEDQIRLYTNGYLRMVSLGMVRPDLTPPPLFDAFQGIGVADSLWRPPLPPPPPPDTMRSHDRR